MIYAEALREAEHRWGEKGYADRCSSQGNHLLKKSTARPLRRYCRSLLANRDRSKRRTVGKMGRDVIRLRTNYANRLA
jgi:hypothetical protein